MTKFVIVGIQRTGTTLLRTTLDSHPQISCAGEVFKTKRLGRQDFYKGKLGYQNFASQSWSRRLGHYMWRAQLACEYLDQVYGRPGYSAVGFKLMYTQARRFSAVIPYVKEHDVKVIDVVRINVLKTLISRRTSKLRKFYHSREKPETIKVPISTKSLIGDLERIRQDGTRWAQIFGNNANYIQVSYESFVNNKQDESRRLLDFLNVEYTQVDSPLVKLNSDDLSQIIENYQDVRTCLKDTNFEYCLS